VTAGRGSARQAAYVRLINRLGARLAGAGFERPRLDADALIARARRRSGLEDFGDPAFRQGIERLVAALNSEAQLSQLGRIVAYLLLLNLLSVRLRLLDYRARRREVAAQQLAGPLVITGLPRTGTTILHELLAQDPALRSPASWEVARPVPPPAAASCDGDSRIAFVERLLGLAEQLAPGLQGIHALGARLPQECVYLLSSAFVSDQFGYMFNVPSYRTWLLRQDMAAAYRWHAQFLQHLQVDCQRERWVLKTPAHLGHLGALFAQYPDAGVVWMHRRPLDAVASFSSLACTLRGGFSDAVDPVATGGQEAGYFSRVVAAGMAERGRLNEAAFCDVSFDAICERPLAVVGQIYDHFGMRLSDMSRRRMRDYLAGRPRDLFGEHRYSPADYGLEAAGEAALFGDYLAGYARYLR